MIYEEDYSLNMNNYLYTPRYLSKHWLVIIHNICLELEYKYLHKIQPRIDTSSISWKTGIVDKCIKSQIKILLDYFEEILTYNTLEKLLIYSEVYIYNDIIYIPITKSERYNIKHWHTTNLLKNINKSAIVIQHNNCKFTNIGINNFPKKNYTPRNNEVPYHDVGTNGIPLKPYLYREMAANRFSCQFINDLEIQHNITNINSDEINCLNNGGEWKLHNNN